ncbi:aminotransferase class I/II-fold pyridoxal phosphate-dependent enzyme [Streptomyces sp. ZAF1911]|uniref:DegT/DnrJ/EryC1/StrS family aminotransferase n=1 Tax=Streptomyces sp. ZAF1911 TaxID=2944129 RepID=UPI00237ACB16|nr:aminotransferase class I/II-fold pyridoxal phosphate-dependent enzyme [Streptomyces sp. ZAF1911]MDD9380428.1 aminotransferase class I/II-fold pyridoxal phosphate-dependent enzyme [Streptomyces sp. ZAF1911]
MTLLPLPDSLTPLLRETTIALSAMPDPAGAARAGAYEEELAETFATAHAVAVSSGTAAVHTALAALGIGPGDEILVPALTVIMTVSPIVALGARPVFVDSDPQTLDIDYEDAARKTTARTKAIIAVHLWGRMGDPARLRMFALGHDLAVIEDAAQAVGSSRDGYRAGTVGSAGCFSTKDGKILWSGEGGFILTGDRTLAEYARAYRGHWLQPPPGSRPQAQLATNVRLAEPLAAIGLANLRRLPALMERRRAQAERLVRFLDGAPGLRVLQPTSGEQWNHYAPLLHLDLPQPRAFAEHLAEQGVPSSTGSFRLVPCDTRPAFTARDHPPCPGAALILDRTLAVVLDQGDDEAVIDRYAAIITKEAATWEP